jgi:hypothetical protein
VFVLDNSEIIGGVANTGDKFFTGINDFGGKFTYRLSTITDD